MKPTTSLLSFLVAACVAPSGYIKDVIPGGAGLPGIEFQVDNRVAKAYPGTTCLLVHAHGNKDAGLICRSCNSEFLDDHGIGQATSMDASDDENPVTVNSGISLYEMKKVVTNGQVSYSADIDCDTQNQSIYRPTSTCHIVYLALADGDFIYATMTTEDHVRGEKVLSRAEIGLILGKAMP